MSPCDLNPEAADYLRAALPVARDLCDKITGALDAGLPAYSQEAARFAAAEARALRRRILNMARVLGAVGGRE